MTDEDKGGFPSERDYFVAAFEDGELAMRPHCSCGVQLDETYFCEACRKQCLCTMIYCVDETVLEKVNSFITTSQSFRKFDAQLVPETQD